MTTQLPTVEDILRVTPMQHGMLFHSMLGNSEQQYVQQLVFEIVGEPRVDLLHEAWNRTAAALESLRSVFCCGPELPHPVQVVLKRLDPSWSEDSLEDVADPDARLLAIASCERYLISATSNESLCRLAYIRGRDCNHLIWTFHHLILDGWSTLTVLGSVGDCYRALLTSNDPSPAPRMRLREHAAYRAGLDLTRVEQFWIPRLKGTEPGLSAKLRELTPEAHDANDLAETTIHLNARETADLTALARALNVTLNALVTTLWGAFQARLLSRNNATFGTTVSVRPAELIGSESLVGLFIETVPIAVHLDASRTCFEWLQHEARECMERQQATGLPLSRMGEIASLPSSRHLFETLFVFENYPRDVLDSVQSEGLTLRLTSSFERTNYPLTVVVSPGERLEVRITVAGTCASPEAATCLAQQFVESLARTVTLSPSDLLPSWMLPSAVVPSDFELRKRGPAIPLAASALAHELFAQQVHLGPDAPALQLRNAVMSYRDLAIAASRVSKALSQANVHAGDRVALLLGRSFELVAAMLGAMQIGAIWIPIDPTYPDSRVRYLIDDSGAQAVLVSGPSSSSGQHTEVSIDVARLVCLTEGSLAEQQTSSAHLTQESPAYMIYTSGSTGTPKGALIQHGALANYLLHCASEYELGPGKRCAVFTSPSFDLTITSLLGPLVTGGTAVLVPDGPFDEVLREASALEDIHLLKLTPTHLDILHCLVPPSRLPKFGKIIVVGGEALSVRTVTPWLRASAERAIINEYGPTETTVGCCVEQVRQADLDELLNSGRTCVPIGVPIRNTTLTVRNDDLRVTPMGEAGELYIGGQCVGLGYFERPDLTASRFVRLPGEPSIFYRTGDRVRRLADGRLEYLGRNDDQLKLRGYRVEPVELETILADAPTLKAVAVTAVAMTAGLSELVACVVLKEDCELDEDELRDFARQRVPAHLVPAHWSQLDQLPVTPNGKLDRQALPTLAREELERRRQPGEISAEEDLALGDVERHVLAAFRQAGSNPRLKMDDDFFQFGGDSLRALALVGAIERVTAMRVSLAELYETRSARRLMESVSLSASKTTVAGPMSTTTSDVLVELRPGTHRHGHNWVCLHPSGGEVYHYRDFAEALPHGEAVYGVRDVELVDQRLLPSLDTMAYRILEQVRRVERPISLVGWSFGAILALRVAALADDAQFIKRLVLLDPPDPHHVRPRSSPEQLIYELLEQQGLHEHLPLERALFESLSEPRQVAIVRALVRRATSHRVRVSAEEVRFRLSLVRHHGALLEQFQPARLSLPISVVLAADSQRADWSRVKQQTDGLRPIPTPPWLESILGGATARTHLTPGNHFELMHAPIVQAVAGLFEKQSTVREEYASGVVA